MNRENISRINKEMKVHEKDKLCCELFLV